MTGEKAACGDAYIIAVHTPYSQFSAGDLPVQLFYRIVLITVSSIQFVHSFLIFLRESLFADCGTADIQFIDGAGFVTVSVLKSSVNVPEGDCRAYAWRISSRYHRGFSMLLTLLHLKPQTVSSFPSLPLSLLREAESLPSPIRITIIIIRIMKL